MDLEILLMAAEYVERLDREHGYASSLPPSLATSSLELHQRHNHPPTNKKSTTSTRKHQNKKNNKHLNLRSTHNELEKNRRAHMKLCLERLKETVPLGPDCSRHTTLGLLVEARALIKCLQEKEKQMEREREQLMKEDREMRMKLSSLQVKGYRCRVEHTISESSVSSASPSFSSTSDEIDVTSCSSVSDFDDSFNGDS